MTNLHGYTRNIFLKRKLQIRLLELQYIYTVNCFPVYHYYQLKINKKVSIISKLISVPISVSYKTKENNTSGSVNFKTC